MPANISSHGYDLSTVPLIGAYPASQCPVKTQFAIMRPEGVEPAPVSPILQAAFDAGNEFEALIFARITELHPDAVHVPEGEAPDMTAATVDAMDRQVPIILGGWLPVDEVGRRTGKPDVLMFDGDGYLPVDVKLYTLLKESEGTGKPALVSDLARPSIDDADPVVGAWSTSNRRKAAFQLAHYWRMLEACGKAASRGAIGGIIDSSGSVVWIDLTASDGRIQNKTTYMDEPVTWLAAYDYEFEFRRDVAAHTVQRCKGADLEPKVVPVWIGECSSCEWNVHCRPELERQDHISLLSYMDYWQFKTLRLAGITARRQLAERDHFTASVVDRLSGAQLRRLLDEENADNALANLWSRSKAIQPFVNELAAAGIVTAADLHARLTDQLVIDLAGALRPAWIDQARSSLLGTPFLARGFAVLDLPAYDVEVDFDMENDLQRNVYMWGLLVTRDGERQPYQVFDAYEEDVDGSGAKLEAEVFLQFWNEVNRLNEDASEAGQSFQMFFWSSAELTQSRRICEAAAVDGLPSVEEVEAFFEAHCTDLEGVLKRHFITPSGTSVKKIAAFAGHTWDAVHQLTDDSDAEGAGGDISMIKHRLAVEAVSREVRAGAQVWLRTYNEADVEATRLVRAWMREAVNTLQTAEALDAAFSDDAGQAPPNT